MTAMANFQKGAASVAGAKPCPPRHLRHAGVRTIQHGRWSAFNELGRGRNGLKAPCQQTDSAVVDSGAATAGDELETFETHVGMVEPVDEDDAEVSPEQV